MFISDKFVMKYKTFFELWNFNANFFMSKFNNTAMDMFLMLGNEIVYLIVFKEPFLERHNKSETVT